MQVPHLTLPVSLTDLPLSSIVRDGKSAETPSHIHACGQLLYPELGTSLIETQNSVIRLAPDRAAWIPAGIPHAVLMDRTFRYHSVYIDQIFFVNAFFSVLFISPLLRELIIDASSWPNSDIDIDQRFRKSRVIVDEIIRAPHLEHGIQISDDPKISTICRELQRNPASSTPLKMWAHEVGASEKTIQRTFIARTGMPFQQWRNYVRMTRALELHARGIRLIDIAISVGYSTEGAYAQAFKKFYGYPPSKFQSKK
jgi:AraC-like DNA-binding protein